MSQPNKIRGLRMAKEILDLSESPPHGITCWPVNDSNCSLEASKCAYTFFTNKNVITFYFYLK